MLKYLRMGNKRIKFIWWALIVLTVGTFLGIFVTAFDPSMVQQQSGAVAMVNGKEVGPEHVLQDGDKVEFVKSATKYTPASVA